MIRICTPLVLLSVLAIAPCAWAQSDALTKSLDTAQRAQQASVASQKRVDQLDDQTRALLERYRSATWQAQQLNVYAQQLNELLTQQTARSEEHTSALQSLMRISYADFCLKNQKLHHIN